MINIWQVLAGIGACGTMIASSLSAVFMYMRWKAADGLLKIERLKLQKKYPDIEI
jgi:hypothetical protein